MSFIKMSLDGYAARYLRLSSTLAVVFPFLITGAAAQDNDNSDIVVLAVVLSVLLFIVKLGLCLRRLNKSDEENVEYPQSNAGYDLRYPIRATDPLVMVKATRRMVKQAELGASVTHPPSMPSGRYRGSRGVSEGRVDIEYNLQFMGNGKVQGTATLNGSDFGVQGFYNPDSQQFEWGEDNPGSALANCNNIEFYRRQLTDISSTHYSGSYMHFEVSMRMVATSSDMVSLVGEYGGSDRSQGDQRLIFVPAPLFGPSSSTDSVSVRISPLSVEKSESIETLKSKIEPTLEKESL